MRNELWVMCVGAIMAISLISTLSVLVITNQRTEITALHNQIATQAGQIAYLNATLDATGDRLTVLAQKVNPLIGAECRVDRLFINPEDVPANYTLTHYIFIQTDYPSFSEYGLGVICR